MDLKVKSRTVTEGGKFISDTIWVAISEVTKLLASLAILSVLTKSYASEIYGIWAQVSVTMGLVSLVLTLQFGTALVRFLSREEDKGKRRQAFGAMLWPIVAFICLTVIISMLLRQILSSFLFDTPQYAFFVPLTFLFASVEALFSFSLSYLRSRGKIKRLAVIQSFFTIVKVIMVAALAMAGYSLEWIILGLIVGELLFVAAVFRMIIREIGFPRLNFWRLKDYLAFSAPQIPMGFLLWIIHASDRYFIIHLISLSQAGIYSASYSLGGLISLFFLSVGFVLLPIVSKLWEQRELSKVKNCFEYSNKLFLALALPAVAGLYMLSQPLFRIIATPEYMVGGGLVLLIALGTIFLGIYQINVYIILLVKQTRWLPLMVAGVTVINASINLALIPRIGIMGAAISTIVSYCALATIVILWARRSIKYKTDFKFLSKVVVATVLMAFCLNFINIDSVLDIILAVIAGTATFFLGLFLLRGFSKEDVKLLKEGLSAFKSSW